MSGGGEMLPTEEIFMSRKEKQTNVRLACQVKVKNDVSVFIPDFLVTVKEMIESGNFDTSKKWLVRID
jgi:Na+-transporting NADH:ubiquinone oxidoreductase subunit F